MTITRKRAPIIIPFGVSNFAILGGLLIYCITAGKAEALTISLPLVVPTEIKTLQDIRTVDDRV